MKNFSSENKRLIDIKLVSICTANINLFKKKEKSFVNDSLVRFWESLEYSVNGGKRLRGLLVIATALAVSGVKRIDLLSKPLKNLILDAACAIECVHAFSLVHDDMPCMDNDKLRRGKNTLHVEFDEGIALLAGDALQTLGTEILCSSENNLRKRFLLIKELSKATGAMGMAGGQAIDIQAVRLELKENEVQMMHKLKTGALLEAAVNMGFLGVSLKKDFDKIVDFKKFASFLGIAFQVVDDILDVVGVQNKLGKTVGRDSDLEKPNFVQILGVKKSKLYAEESLDRALGSINNYGCEADFLREIAVSLVKRKY